MTDGASGDRHDRGRRQDDLGDEGNEPGLQVERTELAWIRTALVCGALASLNVHLGAAGSPGLVALGAGTAVAAIGVAAAVARIRALRMGRRGAPPRLCSALLALCVAAADLLALTLLLT